MTLLWAKVENAYVDVPQWGSVWGSSNETTGGIPERDTGKIKIWVNWKGKRGARSSKGRRRISSEGNAEQGLYEDPVVVPVHGWHQRDGNRGGGTSMTKLDSGYSSTRLLFSDWPYGCPPQKPDVGEIKILCLSVSTNWHRSVGVEGSIGWTEDKLCLLSAY